MKKSWKRIAASTFFGGCVAAVSGPAFADLIGGTYSTATGSTWPSAGSPAAAPVYTSLTNGELTGLTSQGYPSMDSNNDGTLLSELVTPSATMTLQAVAIDAAGMATFTQNAMSLNIFPLVSGQAFTAGGLLGSGESPNNGVYAPYVGSNLLGGGAGLPFNSVGISGSEFAIFSLDNGVTNDNIVLTAGTTYAIEFWNLSAADPTDFPSGYNSNEMTWNRNADVDPGGGMFGGHDTLLNGSDTSLTTGLRGTISEEGLAGGAPRTGALALYGTVPEPATLGLLAASAAGLMLRRRKA